MAKHTSPKAPKSQQLRVCVCNNTGYHFFNLCQLLYVKGSGNSCIFYIADTPTGPLRTIVSSRNLGYFNWLLAYNFRAASQSVIYNHERLKQITRDKQVLLDHAIGDVILITEANRATLLAAMSPYRS